jgi:hypothetical protein
MYDAGFFLARLYVAGGYFPANLISVDDKSAPVGVRVWRHHKLRVLFHEYLAADRWIARPGTVEFETLGGSAEKQENRGRNHEGPGNRKYYHRLAPTIGCTSANKCVEIPTGLLM